MKITSTILSIPPYLSTTWKNISSLHVREDGGRYTLIVLLQNRVQVEVPHLDKPTIDEIFEAHARSAEQPFLPPVSFKIPFKEEGGLDTLGSAMQHNPDQSDLPPLPPEVLEKITKIAQAFGLEDTSALPKAEPHCNCAYCQVVRAFTQNEPPLEEAEPVTEAELHFRDWEIKEESKQLYRVTNPLDANEHYNVFLGEPLGCTCGLKNCEHIRAVLNS